MIVRRDGTRERGFTLLEIVVAISILAIVVGFVYQLLSNVVNGRDMIRDGLTAPKVQNTILGQILRDFRYIYWVDFAGGGGFLGQNRSVGGKDADRVDFVTARHTRLAHADDSPQRDPGESPLTEVGYALRQNDKVGGWLELWRREDYFVDDDPVNGGTYSLIYDKIRSFNLTYYPNPKELGQDEKGLEEWDSRIKHSLPYAIIVEMKFDVGDPPSDRDQKDPESVTRIILLRAGAEDAVAWPTPDPAAMTGMN